MRKIMSEIRLHGLGISPGIAIGSVFLFSFSPESVSTYTLNEDELPCEIIRYKRSLDDSRREIQKLRSKLANEGVLEGAAILDTHLQMLQDPHLTSSIEERILKTRLNAEAVFQSAVYEWEMRFEKITDPFFRERIKDLRDVANRVLAKLGAHERLSLASIPQGSIVFAHELCPSDAALAEKAHIEGFVAKAGGDTSHAAIMAKAKGIPFVRIEYPDLLELDEAQVIIDGTQGEVIINPTPKTLERYLSLKDEWSDQMGWFASQSDYKSETIDGYEIRLSANVEMEMDLADKYEANGIGLFRSEYVCLAKESFPNEQEQFEIYKKIAESMEGRPVVIRTFDVGGDKFTELFGSEEENPFLGCRAIRFMLKEHESFKIQLRAILRASVYGDVRLLFPMVTGLPELIEAKQYVQEVMDELRADKIPFAEDIQIGSMIEVPSAAIICDVLAQHCDFLSIGTNDLVQYSLAVDRDNQEMNYLYTPAHPGVIRLIRMIVAEANRNGISVSLCGEMAADPRFTALLLGLGIHELSVSPRHIPMIKHAIRNVDILSAHHLAEKVLAMPTAVEVLEVLIEAYQKDVLGASIGELILT